jgi:hypothetical protein
VESIDLFNLKAVNQLESTFLTMCNYELYVSEHLYQQYYSTIIQKTSTQTK